MLKSYSQIGLRQQEEAKEKRGHMIELAKQHGVENHPKLELLYAKCWDLGHAAGYHEVAAYFADLVDLIK